MLEPYFIESRISKEPGLSKLEPQLKTIYRLAMAKGKSEGNSQSLYSAVTYGPCFNITDHYYSDRYVGIEGANSDDQYDDFMEPLLSLSSRCSICRDHSYRKATITL